MDPSRRLGLLVLTWLVLAWFVQAAGAAPHTRFATDHVLVKFRRDRIANLAARAGADVLSVLQARLGIAGGALQESPGHHLLRLQRRRSSTPDLDHFFYLKLPPGLTVSQCLQQLRGNPDLEYAEADGRGEGGLIPNDPSFSLEWHHHNLAKPGADIATPATWDITVGSSNVIVAVLDSGLRTNLQDFAGRVVPGYDFANNDADPFDDEGHGTAVTATLLATGNNGLAVAGVDWRCRIMPIKVLGSDNTGFYSWWADGIDYAVAHGAKIINLSAGGSGSSDTLTAAINHAIVAGVIFVTITHNDGLNVIRYPGNLTQCITVGASNEQDQRAGFSNYGPQIDLIAPGTNIWTLSTSGTPSRWYGTSFSAPLVSGVCALLVSCRPEINQEDAFRLLALGADDHVGDAADTPGFDDQYGWGRLNAYHSVMLAKTQIDLIETTNTTGIMLSWPSPDNAADKHPFYVDYGTSSAGPWATFSDPANFHYTSSRTTWIDDGSLTGSEPVKFFRLHLRGL